MLVTPLAPQGVSPRHRRRKETALSFLESKLWVCKRAVQKTLLFFLDADAGRLGLAVVVTARELDRVRVRVLLLFSDAALATTVVTATGWNVTARLGGVGGGKEGRKGSFLEKEGERETGGALILCVWKRLARTRTKQNPKE